MTRFLLQLVCGLAAILIATAGEAAAQQAYDLSGLSPDVRGAAQEAREAQTLAIRASGRAQFRVEGTVSFYTDTEASYQGEGFGSGPGAGTQRDGFGVLTWADREFYAGQFMSADSTTGGGDMHGYGVYGFVNGHIYEGQWRHEQRNGYGVQWLPDGQILHAGLWRAGQPVD